MNTTIRDQRQYIGGHGIGGLVGKSPYETPTSVYRKCLGIAEPKQPTEAMRWGLIHEPQILQEYLNRHGIDAEKAEQQKHLIHPKYDFLRGTPDMLDNQNQYIVDAKNLPHMSNQWGEPGTDHIPDHILIQLQWYMHLANLQNGVKYESAVVAVLVHGNRYAEYNIDYSPTLCNALEKTAVSFYDNHVIQKKPPNPDATKDYADYIDTLFMNTRPAEIAADNEIERHIEAVLDIRQQKKELDEKEMEHKNHIRAFMTDHERLLSGIASVTNKPVNTTRIDVKRLRKEAPEIAEKYSKESQYKSLRITAKKGK